MKAFYDKVYRIYDDRKISDTVLLFRMTVTVIIILSCLAVMTFVGYAYYEYELIIKINTIQSATFEVNVTVADNENNPVEMEKRDGNYMAKSYLTKDTQYTVTISRTENSSAETGFCRVKLFNENNSDGIIYYTIQLNADTQTQNEVTFTIKPLEDFKLKITPNWGTSSYWAEGNFSDCITNGKIINFPENPTP
ncbi:MAG: hypothetical protein IIT39_05370 [Clostridia bacterium]|nr:hypothetical protein [Clostridia bacterium]